MDIARYSSSIADAQLSLVTKPMLPPLKKLGRVPIDRRQIINYIFYVLMGGIQWRMLPSSFPPWQMVYHVFGQWSKDHTWVGLNDCLRVHVRGSKGKRSRPTATILDSQNVKSDPHGGQVDYDAGKRIKGQKRNLWVDRLGMLLEVCVSPASTGDRSGAKKLLDEKESRQTGEERGFQVKRHRRKVERTIGWLMQGRRMVRDYEKTETSAKAWIYLRMIDLQIRRLG